MKSIKTALFGVFAAFILSACGGGGGGGNTPTVQMPDNPQMDDMQTDNPPADNPPAENFNTAEFRENYGLASIRADSAYKARAFGQGVTVGVIDSGVLTSHIDLRDNIVAGRDFVLDTSEIDDANGNGDNRLGHGTAVAGVIGARRLNGGVHGVAPSVRIMPLQIGDENGDLRGDEIAAARWGIQNGAKILNASFGYNAIPFPIAVDYQGAEYWLHTPGLVGVIAASRSENQFRAAVDSFRTNVAEPWDNAVRGQDVVVVFAAGNDGFNSVNGIVTFSRQLCLNADRNDCFGDTIEVDFNTAAAAISNLETGDFSSVDSEIPLWVVDNIADLIVQLGRGDITAERFEQIVLADSDFQSTANRWLSVVSTDENNRIASHSNGCGLSGLWCIAAPGVRISTTSANNNGENGNNQYDDPDGTSFAAPHVSGALALLKSAAPELRMTVIRNVLLTTATDLGDSGVDEVYGWGLVNVSAGIATLNGMQIPATAGRNAVAVRDLREGLPGELSHLRGRMSDVSVAVQITDDYYENVALSDIVGGDSQKTKLGNAAKEMQADDFTAGESFRFWGGLEYDDSRSSYIGESGGIFSAENASDTGGYVKWTTKNYGGISAFGEYGRTQIKADYDSNSFVSKIQNARAEEWTAGFQYRDLFLHNDSLQFSARQESRISGGEMVLHYPVADGDSHKAFIGESPQTIRTETARIPIKQKPQTIYTAGYSQKTENGKWSTAAEWNTATNAKGVSFAVELQIR